MWEIICTAVDLSSETTVKFPTSKRDVV
eukprot:SAG31_NODE_38420_length_296_cov_0.791878_1_plen_27_part_10